MLRLHRGGTLSRDSEELRRAREVAGRVAVTNVAEICGEQRQSV